MFRDFQPRAVNVESSKWIGVQDEVRGKGEVQKAIFEQESLRHYVLLNSACLATLQLNMS